MGSGQADMNYLSLFSGACGGDLAFQHLLTDFKCVGYVEYEPYPQAIIRQRISDGLLDDAPIFSDIKDFISEGWAEAYQGMVDLVTAGFPCQPFSVAGKQLAEKDSRNLWPETIKAIRIIQPTTVFLENVPNLLTSEYALTIFRQLGKNGYKVLPPLKLGADDIGANHRRKRIWIVAYSRNGRTSERTGQSGANSIGDNGEDRQAPTDHLSTSTESGLLANATKQNDRGCDPKSIDRQIQQSGKCNGKDNISESCSVGKIKRGNERLRPPTQDEESGGYHRKRAPINVRGEWWATEPAVG